MRGMESVENRGQEKNHDTVIPMKNQDIHKESNRVRAYDLRQAISVRYADIRGTGFGTCFESCGPLQQSVDSAQSNGCDSRG